MPPRIRHVLCAFGISVVLSELRVLNAAAGSQPSCSFEVEKDAVAAFSSTGQEGLEIVRSCGPEEPSRLIGLGWWSAARELVQGFHRDGNRDRQVAMDSAVRKQVAGIKQSAEELVVALRPQAESVGLVRCSFQWAQNSTSIFMTIKFAHRWSSPGALKITDEIINVTGCCFNFSANGEHSQLRKKYALDLHFWGIVHPDRWSWQLASAGRLTVEIQKVFPGVWKRLLKAEKKPGNMASWDSMQTRWASELEEFEKEAKKRRAEQQKTKKRKSENQLKDKPVEPDEDDEADIEESEDEAEHEDLANTCINNEDSPFYDAKNIANLCDIYWPPRMPGKLGRSRTWLILFYSPKEMNCAEKSSKCLKPAGRWEAVANKFKDWPNKAQVGSVNCDLHKPFCTKQEVGHMPFVRRYKAGKRKVYYGEWDVDSVMSFLES